MAFQDNTSVHIKCIHALEGQNIQLGNTKLTGHLPTTYLAKHTPNLSWLVNAK